MEWLTFDGVDWLAVVVAFVSTFVIGFLWYSPKGLFPLWMKHARITEEQMAGANPAAAFGQTIVANILGIILLAVLMAGLGIDDWAGGLVLGALVGLIFRGGAHALHNGFALRSPVVTALDAAHDTLGLAVAGLVLGLF